MSDEERVKLIIQIASSFGISYDEASYIIKSFENFGKEFMMSEADKMFEELGYEKLDNEKLNYIQFIREINNITKEIIIFSKKFKKVEIYFYDFKEHIEFIKPIDMQELQAINQKCKELRWIE